MFHDRWKKGALAVSVLCAIAVTMALSIPLNPSSVANPAATFNERTVADDSVVYGSPSQLAADLSGSSLQGPAEQGAANPGVWYEGAPEFEEGYVLADFAEGVTVDDALAVFAGDERLSGVGVARETDEYVKLSLPADLGVKEAVGLLVSTGVVSSAQPNYTYYLMDDPVGEIASPGGSSMRFEPAQLAVAKTASLVAGTRLGDALGVQSAPNDPRFSEQWALTSASLPKAWDVLEAKSDVKSNGEEAGRDEQARQGDEGESSEVDEQGENPVVIAVIDQGFQVSHPDLVNNVVDTYDAALGRSGASGVYANHGTHVAGIVGAEVNNGIGVAGSTNNRCKMMLISLVRYDVLSHQYTMSTDTLVDAYSHVLDFKAAGNDVRVVNLSVGDPRDEATRDDADVEMYDAIQKAYEAGVLTVAAACNTGGEFSTAPFYAYPSDFEQVVSVINLQKSTNAEGVERASGSNYNMPGQMDKDISAPGGSILSTYPGSSYSLSSGTSMASPLVAGVAGLVFTANPQMTPDEVASKLYSTAKDLTKTQNATDGWDRVTGYGEVDAAAAVSDEAPYLACATLLATGETMSCAVKIDGAVQDGWTWSSSDPGVARVNAEGVVRGISQGQAIISAANGNASAYQTITVRGDSVPIGLSDGGVSVSVADQVYTGTNRLPVPEVYDGDAPLVMNTHFTASWSDNLNAGTGTVTITGIGAYTGQLTQTFTIAKIPLSSANISVYPTSIQGDGTPKTPTVIIRDIGDNENVVLEQGVDYTLTSTNTIVGEGSVTFAATERCQNFRGEDSRSYTVSAPVMPTPPTPPTPQPPSPPSEPDPPAQPDPPSEPPDPPAQPRTVEVVDEATGVSAEGEILSGADVRLEVVDVAADDEAGARHVEALEAKYFRQIESREVAGVYRVDVTKSGAPVSDVGNLVLEFPVEGFDGRTAKVIQLHDDGNGSDPQVILHEGLPINAGVVRVEIDGRLSEFIIAIDAPPRPETDPVYRLYNPNTGEHHYTLSSVERDHLVVVGWHDEGVGWYAPHDGGDGARAIHRLYNPNAGVHHYTVSDYERDYLVGLGWSNEGDLCYTAEGFSEAVALYRSYSPHDELGCHNYTASYGEHSFLLDIGWQDEGVAWYGFAEQ